MSVKDFISDEYMRGILSELGFKQSPNEGRLILAELLVKAAAGYRNSHTEEKLLESFYMMKKDRTANRRGRRFLCEMFYACSNRAPEGYYLMRDYRSHVAN